MCAESPPRPVNTKAKLRVREAGMRIIVSDILDYLAAGTSED
jgi:hypothetical protein